jgi:predicted metal-dependent hydrolase
MPYKEFQIDNQVMVRIYKRRANRNVRLSLQANGEVRVSIPLWAPYKAGTDFATKKLAWIKQHKRAQNLIVNGQNIGKQHTVQFEPTDKTETIRTRITSNQVIVRFPAMFNYSHPAVQAKADAACVRALKREAELLLPPRLAALAAHNDFNYRSLHIKRLKSRWGSCDSQQNIILNLYLVQLPWECIDYVLLHELTHTVHMNHSANFWQAMNQLLPNVKDIRKTLKEFQPLLHSVPHEPMQ